MEEEIGDIQSEHFVINLSAEQLRILDLLYADPDIDRELKSIAFRFHQEKDDLRQKLALKLAMDGYELRDAKCLKSWCFVTASNLCRNDYRHDKVVQRHGERCAGESVQSRRRGGAVVVQHSEVKTPEQQMLEQEHAAQLQAMLDEVIGSLPTDVQVIAKLWGEGKPPREIAKAVGKSVPTVYRKHSEFQRVLVERVGSWNAAADNPAVIELEPLISHSLCSFPSTL